MGKGMRRPVVAASMPVIRFGGEGKWRGEWGVKSGAGSATPFLGEEGTPGQCLCVLEAALAAAPSVAQGRRSSVGSTRQ
jgi:hypothetical protein